MRYAPHRRGSIIIMVLIVLAVTTMLVATFLAMMTTYRSSGTRQSARQITTQIALAGATYSRHLIMRDHAVARNAAIPQRYTPKTFYTTSARGSLPYPYAGPIPAQRAGLDWLIPTEGRLSGTFSTAEIPTTSGGPFIITLYTFRANRYPKTGLTPAASEPTRPMLVDTVDPGHEVLLQYANWKEAWYSNNDAPLDAGDLVSYRSPFGSSSYMAKPRWWTAAYYDVGFQPLDWSDRTLAAYEARFFIDPIPLDGCLNVNFGDRVLSATSGGLYRLGARLPAPVPNPIPIPLVYRVDPATDVDWSGRSFPLALQYAAGLNNILGVIPVNDDNTTRGLSVLVNIACGQGYRGNLPGYNAAAPVHTPTVAAGLQVGTPASWRQMHANVGFDLGSGTPSDYRRTVTEVNNIMPISTFMLTPFGSGLDRNRIPLRNRPDATGALADIDCPWYVNASFMTALTARGMVGGMDSSYYTPLRPIHRSDLLPTPPSKADPVDASKIAVWNDGVARTGADGIEGGAMPPVAGIPKGWVPTAGSSPPGALVLTDAQRAAIAPNVDGQVLSTGYRRPPIDKSDSRNNIDSFHANIFDVWKNPVREQCAVEHCIAPYFSTSKWIAAGNLGNQSLWMAINSGNYTRKEECIGEFAVAGGRDHHIMWDPSGQAYLGSPAACIENYDPIVGLMNGTVGQEQKRITALDNNTDTVDERLSWQNDIVVALQMALIDLRSDQAHGKLLNPDAPHGYETIEDLETVFLAHLGISVRYVAPYSNASTLAAKATDYQIYHGVPAVPVLRALGSPPNNTWPLGRRNQLWALAQLKSLGAGMPNNEVGYDRGHYLSGDGSAPYIGDLPYDAGTGIINADSWTQQSASEAGNPRWINSGSKQTEKASRAGPGQYGFRSYKHTSWPAGYRPTWAALSRVLEHRLNDVRMSLFGTPALDLNGDGIYDATTNDGTGEVDISATPGTFPAPAASAPKAQLRFSSTGRLYLGQARYWRVFVKGQLWDRRGDRLVDEAALEQVFVIDPDGNGNLSDSHVLFSRPHDVPVTSSHTGPSREGRTEAVLP